MILTAELQELKQKVEQIADRYGLNYFAQIFEIVDYDQLNEIASYDGFPTRYPHWRFGMAYDRMAKTHSYGMGKIYELVINNDPCYAYLLQSNSSTENKLVMAHVYGHNDFFKNNYWFSKTYRKMMDQTANHGTRIRRYYDRYGYTVVEDFIDACLSIEDLIDVYSPFIERENKPESLISNREEAPTPEVPRLKAKSYMEEFINPPEYIKQQQEKMKEEIERTKHFPVRPEKDIMKFLLDHAPMADWQRDILNMIRKEAYYFVPQRQTKIMNEGWASYWHSKIMTHDLLIDAEVISYADIHSSTMGTRPGVINPYKLGLELYRHIERRWDMGRFGSDYHNCTNMHEKANWDTKAGLGREKIFEVRRIHNDITFIDAYLDEEFANEQKLFTYGYDKRTGEYVITDRDYTKVKEKLLFSLTNFGQPFIYITDGNWENRGELYLRHEHKGYDLELQWAKDTLKNIHRIWGRPVHLETQVEDKYKCLCFDGEKHEERSVNKD